MKAERRHELQENLLAAWLAKQIDAIKPYWQVIIGVAIVATLVLIVSLFIRSRFAAEKAVGWDDYFDAVANRDIDKLEKVADANKQAVAGLWSLQAAGDERLLDGLNRLYSNPAAQELELHKAVENYELVLKRTEEPMLVRRALFGLARAHESLQELEDAKRRYGELAERFPDSSLGAVAKRRIEALSRSSTKEFLTWFSKQEFEVPRTPPPGAGQGSSPPGAGGRMPPFGAGGGMPAPGGTSRSSPEEEALMELPSLTDPLGIGGSAAGQPAGETPDGDAPAPTDAQPGTGGATDDAAADPLDTPSETPAAEGAKSSGESTKAAAGVETDSGPTPESAGDEEPTEPPASPAEPTPEKADAASESE